MMNNNSQKPINKIISKIKNNNSTSYKSQVENILEKKTLIYIVIVAILLLFFAQIFIHDIVAPGAVAPETDTITDTQTVDINLPGNKDDGQENTDNQQQGDNQQPGNNQQQGDNQQQGNNETPVVNNLDRIIVTEASITGTSSTGKKWSELKELSMFRNKDFQYRSIIAPGSEGEYTFTVENESTSNFNYQILFTEENPYKVNMVFKLKRNGEYVLGNQNEWASASGLSRTDLRLNSKQIDVYTVEWRWEHTGYDTSIGELDYAYYKVYADVQAEQIIP